MASSNKYHYSYHIGDQDVLCSSFINMLRCVPKRNMSIYVVPQMFNRRIDLIARALYGDNKMAWVLREINSITSVQDVAVGRYLWFVSKADFDRLYTQWRHSNG